MLKALVKRSLQQAGWAIHRVPKPRAAPTMIRPVQDRVHYACGYKYLPGWLNVDIIDSGPPNDYMYVNLVGRHPFPDNHFGFAFCEDFVEHINQGDSLVFLEEAHRTLRPGGVFRVTFPCLDEVLKQHFADSNFETYTSSRAEVFAQLGHVHYYSRSSFALVARHIGFDALFVAPGQSSHPPLQGINTRTASVNVHVELTKSMAS